MPLQHPVPIQRWQLLGLQPPGGPGGLGAIVDPFREAGLQYSAISELRQYNFAVFHRQRAGAVAQIRGLKRLVSERGHQVLSHHWRLFTHCSGGFGVAGSANVPKPKDIGVGFMA